MNIAILGSTGSIGKTLLNIVLQKKKLFKVKLITANKNYKTLLKQAKQFKVNNVIITDHSSYVKAKKINQRINIYNDYKCLNKIFKRKIDYTMSSIIGIDGLLPTLSIIKHTKKIAIANKESIICGWNLIQSELKENKTEFIPVDSEHFSIWYGLRNNKDFLKNIYITASGGPFIDYPLSNFKNITVKEALKHPNWKMGKKITIDSATLMNKVFEVVEAKKIFNLSYKNIKIFVHPNSYIHSILHFRNGLINLIAHDTNMKIPILNTLQLGKKHENFLNSKINQLKLNSLKFNKINTKRYPLVKLINSFPEKNSLFETIIVTANDELVRKFLEKKIKFTDISKALIKISKIKAFLKYKSKTPKNINEIIKLSDYVRLKLSTMSIYNS